ncbi:MAG: hypothetical protein KDK40_05040, partial [Chlamydiia bacterium]|nr:hypothetical protein [Chlamydiia bacterium]
VTEVFPKNGSLFVEILTKIVTHDCLPSLLAPEGTTESASNRKEIALNLLESLGILPTAYSFKIDSTLLALDDAIKQLNRDIGNYTHCLKHQSFSGFLEKRIKKLKASRSAVERALQSYREILEARNDDIEKYNASLPERNASRNKHLMPKPPIPAISYQLPALPESLGSEIDPVAELNLPEGLNRHEHARQEATAIHLGNFLATIIHDKQLGSSHLQNAVYQVAQNTIMHTIGNLATSVQNVTQRPEKLHLLANRLLTLTHTHLEKLEWKRKLPKNSVLTTLTKGEIPSSQLSAQDNRDRLHTFYRPLSKKILKIIAPTGAKALNLPKQISDDDREIIWDQLTNHILPNALASMVKEMNQPHRKKELLLTAFETLQRSSNTNLPNTVSRTDHSKLDDQASILIKNMTQLLSGHFLQKIIKKNTGNMTTTLAQTLGEALANKIDNTDWNAFLDESLKTAIDTLAPGGEQTMMFNTTPKGGNVERVPEAKANSQITDEKMNSHVKQVFGFIFSNSIKSLTGFWTRIHQSIEKRLEGIPALLRTKQVVDALCHFVFFTCLGNLVKLSTIFIWYPIYLLIERYGTQKIREIEEIFLDEQTELLLMDFLSEFVGLLESGNEK